MKGERAMANRIDDAADYALQALRAGRRVTEADLMGAIPGLTEYGASFALDEAYGSVSPKVKKGELRHGSPTLCTTTAALQSRKNVERMDRAAANLPRTKGQR